MSNVILKQSPFNMKPIADDDYLAARPLLGRATIRHWS